MHSSLVGVENGPRRIVAIISGEESLAVTVAIACIRPNSPSSDTAKRSLCWRFHHSLISGISAGCAVPNNLLYGSGSVRGTHSRPDLRRCLHLKNNSVLISRSWNQNPQSAERLNHDCMRVKRFRVCRWVPPDPGSDSSEPVPYGWTQGQHFAS